MYEVLYLSEDGSSFSITVEAVNSNVALRLADKQVIEDGYNINDYAVSKVYCLK